MKNENPNRQSQGLISANKDTKDTNVLSSIQESKITFLSEEAREQLSMEVITKPELEDFEPYRITDYNEVPIPVPILVINEEMISTREDLLIISGSPKSGKSAFLSMIIAGSISKDGKIQDGFAELQVLANSFPHAVIHVDTEQARHRHFANLNNILKRAGHQRCPDYFLSYNIRRLDLEQYKPTLSGICQSACEQFGGIHSIFIDGGADFVHDVNDQAASNAIVKYFEELAIMYNTAVYVVIHTNPNSDKERGHLGSQVQRKSGGVITVKSQGDYSYIEPKVLRYAGKGDIPMLMFGYDKSKGYHVPMGIMIPESKEEAKERQKINEAYKLSKTIFGGQVSYQYKEAIQTIMEEIGKSIVPAKNLFTAMKENEMILQSKDDRWRINPAYQMV